MKLFQRGTRYALFLSVFFAAYVPCRGDSNPDSFIDLSKKGFQEVAMLSQSWRFAPDRMNEGLAAKWYAVDFNDSSWPAISIMKGWESSGYAGYDGLGWYRTKFLIPDFTAKQFQGRQIILKFGAVDEIAWVYLNGKLVGTHDLGSAGWDKAFGIDITKHVDYTRENTLVVRVHDSKFQGGIFKPVSIGYTASKATCPSVSQRLILENLIPNSKFEVKGESEIASKWKNKKDATDESISAFEWVDSYKGKAGCLKMIWKGGSTYTAIGPSDLIRTGKHASFRLSADYLCMDKGLLQFNVHMLDRSHEVIASAKSPVYTSEQWKQESWDFEVPKPTAFLDLTCTNVSKGSVVLDNVSLFPMVSSTKSKASSIPVEVEVWPLKWNNEHWNDSEQSFHSIHQFPVPMYFALKSTKTLHGVSLLIDVPDSVVLKAATTRTPKGRPLKIETHQSGSQKTYSIQCTSPVKPGKRYIYNSVVAAFDTKSFVPGKKYRILCTPVWNGKKGDTREFQMEFLPPLRDRAIDCPFWLFSYRPGGDLLGFAPQDVSNSIVRLYEAVRMMNIHPIPDKSSKYGGYSEAAYTLYKQLAKRGWKETVIFYNAMLVGPSGLPDVRLNTDVNGHKADPRKNSFGYQRVCPSYVLDHGDLIIPKLKEWYLRRNYGQVRKGQIAEIDYEPWSFPTKYCFCKDCIARFCKKCDIPQGAIKEPRDILKKYPSQWAVHWRDMISESYKITVKAARELVGDEGVILDYNYHYNLKDDKKQYESYLLSMPKDSRGYDELVWHLTSYYNNLSVDGFDLLEKQSRLLKSPIVPVAWIGMGSSDYDRYSNWPPEYWRLFIHNAASNGSPFAAAYPGICIDGKYFWFAHHAMLELEKVHQYYKEWGRDRSIKVSAPAKVRWRAHSKGNSMLLTVFNYSPTESKIRISTPKRIVSAELVEIEQEQTPRFIGGLNADLKSATRKSLVLTLSPANVAFIMIQF